MKKIGLLLLTGSLLLPLGGRAQSAEIQQLLLNVEKLAQFKQILSDMKKGYRILEGGYNTVKDISQGNFSLHKAFLDGLMQVSPTVRNYRRVADIINYQVVLVREYRSAYSAFAGCGNFSAGELDYLSGVYSNLFKASLRNLDELLVVITAGQVRMSDDERLREIDRICDAMQDKLHFLRDFNNSTTVLALQRGRERSNIGKTGLLHGIELTNH